MKTAFFLWLGLATGNFLYQITFKKKDWSKAVEISFFQGLAIVLAYLNRTSF